MHSVPRLRSIRHVVRGPDTPESSYDKLSLGSAHKENSSILPFPVSENLYSGQTLDISTEVAFSPPSETYPGDLKFATWNSRSVPVSAGTEATHDSSRIAEIMQSRKPSKQTVLGNWSDNRMNVERARTISSFSQPKAPLSQIKDKLIGRNLKKLEFKWEPYEYLKMCDEMDQFYNGIQNHTFKANSKEFQQKLRLLEIKLYNVERLMNGDPLEFNFIFRDFMGHFTALVESADSWKWATPFIMPFLLNMKDVSYGPEGQLNSSQALKDVCLVIKGLSNLRAKHLKYMLLVKVWEALVEILDLTTPISAVAFETMQEIASCAEPCPRVVDRLIYMRQHAGKSDEEYFSPGKLQLRQYQCEIILNFLSNLDSQEPTHKVYKKACLKELTHLLVHETNFNLSNLIQTVIEKFGNGVTYGNIECPTTYSPGMFNDIRDPDEILVLSPVSPPSSFLQELPAPKRHSTYHGRSSKHSPKWGTSFVSSTKSPVLAVPAPIGDGPAKQSMMRRSSMRLLSRRAPGNYLNRGRTVKNNLATFYQDRVRKLGNFLDKKRAKIRSGEN